MAERVRQGPCGVPACPEPEKSSGQWAYIPEGNEKEVARGAHCVCKKADCLRYFGLKEEAQRPGRKTNEAAGVARRARQGRPLHARHVHCWR